MEEEEDSEEEEDEEEMEAGVFIQIEVLCSVYCILVNLPFI